MDTKKIQTAIDKGIGKAAACFGATLASDEAEDIGQDVWVKLLESYDPAKGEIGALAYTAAYNATIDALRARKPQASKPEGKDGEEIPGVETWDVEAHQESSRFVRPDVALLAKERAALLVAAADQAGCAADLTAMVDGSADLDNGAVRVRKTRLQRKLAEEVRE